MGKLKTKKGVAKRFKLSKGGKVKYYPGGKSHLATSKEPERLRKLRKKHIMGDKKQIKYLKRLLPYA